MEKEGAMTKNENENTKSKVNSELEKLGSIEGKKCKAPHTHQWGDIAFHNAMICSVFEENEEIKVCF